MKIELPYKFNDYPIDDYDSFLNSINEDYKNLTKSGYTIGKSKKEEILLKDLQANHLKDGFVVNHKGVKFDCLITPSRETSRKNLFCIFSGYRRISADPLPVFKRWSFYPFIDAIVLNIADPMLSKFEKLSLGWYYGSYDKSYIEYLAELIMKVCSLLNINSDHLYLFGSSGGGYVALQLSMYLKNATHIAINPQVLIHKHNYSSEFTRQTGIDLTLQDRFRRNETPEIIAEAISANNSRFLIQQNVQDKSHCTDHLFPLLQKLKIDKLHFGLNCFCSLNIWLYSCVGGHTTQGDQLIFSHLLHLANNFQTTNRESHEPISKYEHFIIQSVSCLWRQLEFFKSESTEKQKKLEAIKNVVL